MTVSAALVSSSPSSVNVPILSVSGSSASSVNHQLTSSIINNNPRMAVTSAVVRPAGSPTTSVSPSQPHPPPSQSTTGGGPTQSGRCCDTGRPLFNDPITGQTICSCQYELLGNYQRLGGMAPAALSMYSAPYAAAAAAAEGMAAYFPTLGAEQTPFYTTGVSLLFFFFSFSIFYTMDRKGIFLQSFFNLKFYGALFCLKKMSIVDDESVEILGTLGSYYFQLRKKKCMMSLKRKIYITHIMG